MKIRRALVTDILKVSRLWAQMAKELDVKSDPNLSLWRKRIEELMHSPFYTLLLAEEGGKILGFLDFFLYLDPSTAKIHATGQHFYVLFEYRCNGIAGKLWNLAVKYAKNQGVEEIEVFCAKKEKPFWEKHGFVVNKYMMTRRN